MHAKTDAVRLAKACTESLQVESRESCGDVVVAAAAVVIIAAWRDAADGVGDDDDDHHHHHEPEP